MPWWFKMSLGLNIVNINNDLSFFVRLRNYYLSSMLDLSHVCLRTWQTQRFPAQKTKKNLLLRLQTHLVWEYHYQMHGKKKRCAQYACWKWLKERVWWAAEMDAITDCTNTAWKSVSLYSLINKWSRLSSVRICYILLYEARTWGIH